MSRALRIAQLNKQFLPFKEAVRIIGSLDIEWSEKPSKEELQARTRLNMINVFIPTTPIPTSGIFILVPAKELIYLDMSVEEALKLVVSGGKVTPGYKKEGPKDGE